MTVKDKLRCPCKMQSRESKFRKSSCNQKLTIRKNQSLKLRRKCKLDPQGTLSCSSNDDHENEFWDTVILYCRVFYYFQVYHLITFWSCIFGNFFLYIFFLLIMHCELDFFQYIISFLQEMYSYSTLGFFFFGFFFFISFWDSVSTCVYC